MNTLDTILLRERTLITCRAFFPGSKNTFSGVICYKGGKPVLFIEINLGWNDSITYDVWVYGDHYKSAYAVTYDQMCARLKELNRIL
jgi:hypothetical protein